MIPSKGRYLFTSESVTEGHPDKVADQISDAVLDALLEQDPNSHVACETLVTTGMAIIAGEISTKGYADLPSIVRKTIKNIGYTGTEMGFDAQTCAVLSTIDKQSPDIAQGVLRENPEDQGAGDQGMMFGFASNETATLMPAPIYWAHQLSLQLSRVRKNGIVDFFRPDGKTQVSFEYVDGKPHRIEAVVISAQHDPSVHIGQLRDEIMDNVILPVIPDALWDANTKIYINPTGRFVLGGPAADTGLTGRKIIADTYGGYARHGGGAFSGKDPTKVDRSAAYMARYVAKHIVAAGLADKCEIQLSYAIGVAQPVSIMVDTFGTSKVPEDVIRSWVMLHIDLRPGAIIETLNLRRPIYEKTAAYGHFGREEFPWEKLNEDLIRQLQTMR